MKRFISRFFLAVLCFVHPIAIASNYGIYEDHPYEFLMKKVVFRFSENYTINPPVPGESQYSETYPGNIKKSAFRIRTNYDLSDQNGWQASGITRLLSLGTIYSWATDIDIYDTRGVKIGFIDGSIATLESARYDIYTYNEAGKATFVGVALASNDFTHFAITTAENYISIAELTRKENSNTWRVVVSNPGVIDDRIIRIFAGFVVDYQDKFVASAEAK